MAAAPEPARARCRLLVVDDEVQNLDTFKRVWRRDYDIAIATSGERGLELLAEQQFDVVLTDFGMPGMDGSTFVQVARRTQTVAIVMLTGYVDKPEVRQLEQAGDLFGVVGKPWSRASLVEVIERASVHTRTIRAQAPAR